MTESKHLAAQIANLQSQLAKLQTARGGAEVDEMRRIQARADSVAALFGERVPEPTVGQTVTEYHHRTLDKIKRHAPKYAKESLYGGGRASLEAVEGRIFADAIDNAHRTAQPGTLIPMHETDPAGRIITKFAGDCLAWMAPFMRGGQVGFINRAAGGKPA